MTNTRPLKGGGDTPRDTSPDTNSVHERYAGGTNEKEGKEENQKASPSVGGDGPALGGDLLSATTVARMPLDVTEVAVQAWNVMAAECGLSLVRSLTQTRRTALRARLRECGGIDGWRAALAPVPATPFLLGTGDRGWKLDFDALLTTKVFTKLREGAYGNRGTPAPRDTGGNVGWMVKYARSAGGAEAPAYDIDSTAEEAS